MNLNKEVKVGNQNLRKIYILKLNKQDKRQNTKNLLANRIKRMNKLNGNISERDFV